MKISRFACLALCAAALMPSCAQAPGPISPSPSRPQVDVAPGTAPAVAPVAVATTVSTGHDVGAPKVFENLTVFPITSKKQVDPGPIMTLEDAVAKKSAEVRETGASGQRGRGGDDQGGGGAQVNALVIENKGTIPIYVLAGTIVKGGNQDRQIGQDFIIDAKKTVDVDAFCVEHGRWTGERDGVATGGVFRASSQLVTSQVRAAAQYKKSQDEVWSKVAATNEANKKPSASGTLMATLDDADVTKKRAALTARVNAQLATVAPADDVIGIGYAIDGKVRGVRFFANHRVYELYRATLVNTAANDAIIAQAEAQASGKPPAPSPAITSDTVTTFLKEADSAKETEKRDTKGANTNVYYDAVDTYSSRTTIKPKAAAPGAPPASKPIQLSTDVLAK